MSDLELDITTGDIKIEGGEAFIVSDGDAIIQSIKIRLQFFLGEWFLDTRQGIPYYQDILVKNPNFNLVKSILREAIAETPGVAFITKFETSFDSVARLYSLIFEVETTDGDLIGINEPFIIGEVV